MSETTIDQKSADIRAMERLNEVLIEVIRLKKENKMLTIMLEMERNRVPRLERSINNVKLVYGSVKHAS